MVTRVCSFLASSIGLKIQMAITGTLLSLFLLVHMAGNMLILVSPESFNSYAHALTSNKLFLYTAEAGLIALVLVHIVVAVALTRKNKKARPVPYVVKQNSGRSRRSWYSSNMIITGLFVVFFVSYHLLHFKWGTSYTTIQGEGEIRDLARLVIEEFAQPMEVAIYVIAMLVIGFHLLHGVRSLFATYGLETNRTHCLIYAVSRLFVFVVMGGFTLIPLVLFFLPRS